jgi:hypothetical protein
MIWLGLVVAGFHGPAVALILGLLITLAELTVARNYALAMLALLGCTAAALCGMLVTRAWAVRQRSLALARTLSAVADVLDEPANPSVLSSLDRAEARAVLVSIRTAGERHAVSAAARTLDPLACATAHLAAFARENPQRTASLALSLRRISDRLAHEIAVARRHRRA